MGALQLEAVAILLFDEQCERRGVAVEKILFTHRPDLAVAEKAGHAERSQFFLYHPCVMIGCAEQSPPATIATAQAATVNRRALELFFGAGEQHLHILVGGGGIASLKLDGL